MAYATTVLLLCRIVFDIVFLMIRNVCRFFAWTIKFSADTAKWTATLHSELSALGEKTIRLESVSDSNFKPEAMVPGSDFHNLVQPPFQCGLYTPGKSGRAVGHAVRVGDWLVVPTHVLACQPLEAVAYKAGVKVVAPLGDDWEEIMPDISVTRVSSNFPLKKGQVGPITSAMATIAAAESNSGSVGRVSEDDFDALVYRGSTRPGHSGAAYVQSGKIVGIHLGSTAGINMGYVATYIQSKLAPLAAGFENESSDFVYLSKLSAKQLSQLKMRATGDPDEWEVKYQGRYFRLSASEAHKLQDYDDRLADIEFEEMMALQEGEGEGQVSQMAHWQRERQKLNTELASLRKRIREFESAVPASQPSAPRMESTIVQPAVDPLPEYSENLWRGCPVGAASPTVPPITTPTSVIQPTTSSPLVRKSLRTSVGQTQTPARFAKVLESTQPLDSNVLPTPESNRPRPKKTPSSKPSIMSGTASKSRSRASTSTPPQASTPSSKPLPASISQQALVSELFERLARLETRLGGTAPPVPTQVTSPSSGQ